MYTVGVKISSVVAEEGGEPPPEVEPPGVTGGGEGGRFRRWVDKCR